MRKLLLASEFEILFPLVKDTEILSGYKKALFIPTASMDKDYNGYFENIVKKQFLSIGIESSILEISDKSVSDVKNAIDACDIVYVGGGNTFLLLEKMNNCQFKEALEDFFKHGGLYIGSSAGSVVTSPDIGFIAQMDDPRDANLSDYTGLNYTDIAFVPHLDNEYFAPIALSIHNALEKSGKKFMSFKDSQGLYIQDNEVRLIN